MAETNGDDDRVTVLEMPAGHTPTWRNLIPSNRNPSAVVRECGDEEKAVVTMQELRRKHSGSAKDIKPNVRMGCCKLYSVTYYSPIFGFHLGGFSGRICVQGSGRPSDLVGCQVGSILVAINGKTCGVNANYSIVMKKMRQVIVNPPVTLHFVDNEDFISYFVAAGMANFSLRITSTERLDTLHATLQRRCNTTIISLEIINLSIDGRMLLADVTSAIVGSNIEKLYLCGSIIGARGLQCLPCAFGLLKQLKELNLFESQIGEEACNALCTCLPDWSNLEVLSLDKNRLNNQCCVMLANAMRGNTTMKALNLRINSDIDEEGLGNFVQVLRNGETIEGITSSNHQLVIRANVSRMPPELQRLIRINERSIHISKDQMIRKKVAMVMFRGGFTTNHLARMPVGLMPFLIHFMGDPENAIEMNHGCPFAAAYCFIRNCDCADVFGFPSFERLRIESLERENEELRVRAQASDDTIRALEAKVKAMEADAPAKKKLRL